MCYKLDKPYTNKQKADFVCEHQGMKSVETSDAIYMLEDYEELQNGEVIGSETDPEYLEKCRNCEIAKLLDDYEIKFAELKDSYLAKLGNGEDAISEYQTEYNVLKQELAAVLSSIGV